ncbi:hypothetical protein CR513_05232, partial [Mucuna pruriens]
MASTTSEDKDDEEVTFNNLEYLQIAYQELLSNSSTLSLGYKELKRKISKLSKELKENSNLKKENESLKKNKPMTYLKLTLQKSLM